MEAKVGTNVSVYPSTNGVTLAVQPHGAPEIKIELSATEAMKQAHGLILHAMGIALAPTDDEAFPAVVAAGRIALKAVEIAQAAVSDPTRFAAKESPSELCEALEALRSAQHKIHLQICEARGDAPPDDCYIKEPLTVMHENTRG